MPERNVSMTKIIVIIEFFLITTFSSFGQPSPEGGGKMSIMPPFGAPGAMPGSGMGNLPPMMMNPAELQELMNEIKIDKAVSAKILVISRAFVKSLDERVLKIEREELNIKEELIKEHPDLSAIQGAIAKKTRILGEIEFAQIKRDLDIKSLLTEDEYDLWKSAMMQKMKTMLPAFKDNRGHDQPDKPGAPGR